MSVTKFKADAVLFDMDGTLTDSIAAVEAAWTSKAEELGLDPETVIAATHGRRAEDNLMELVPGLKRENIEKEVEKFETSILAFADTPPLSRKSSFSRRRSTGSSELSSNGPMTPRSSSSASGRRPSVALGPKLAFALSKIKSSHAENMFDITDETPIVDDDEDLVDMSVRILPGVKKMVDSLPKERYAVATSGARTYCHGCLDRTGIEIPNVCVTADDKRLKRGKPHPDPFLLAAGDLGVDPKRTVIFEDSPSGIKAAVAAGGIVVAVCTSHNRDQISNLGAHYVIDTMEQIEAHPQADGSIEFVVNH